MEVIFETPCI